jgi:hypothetical protein
MDVNGTVANILQSLKNNRDEIVCDELKELDGNYTKETVLAAMDNIANRATHQTLVTIDMAGYWHLKMDDGLAGPIVSDLGEQWAVAINS